MVLANPTDSGYAGDQLKSCLNDGMQFYLSSPCHLSEPILTSGTCFFTIFFFTRKDDMNTRTNRAF